MFALTHVLGSGAVVTQSQGSIAIEQLLLSTCSPYHARAMQAVQILRQDSRAACPRQSARVARRRR
eukprot:12067069-Alexandrium_andersonii.AAC.1